MRNARLSMLAWLVLACAFAAAAPEAEEGKGAFPKTVTLTSGRQIRVLAVGPIYFRKDPPALMLSYETELRITDMDALREEVVDIWADFRKDVDRAKLSTAVIAAQEKTTDAEMLSASNGYRFVFKRQEDGTWPDKPEK